MPLCRVRDEASLTCLVINVIAETGPEWPFNQPPLCEVPREIWAIFFGGLHTSDNDDRHYDLMVRFHSSTSPWCVLAPLRESAWPPICHDGRMIRCLVGGCGFNAPGC
jgi:hypothetical protein